MIQLATIPKVTKAKQIREYVAAHPKAKSSDVAKAVGVTTAYVATVMWTAKKKAKVAKVAKKAKPKWEQLGLFSSDKSLGQLAYEAGRAAYEESRPKLRMEGDRGDAVNHPAHYKVGGIETIDFIEAKKLNYNIGNVVKYLTRADHKGNRKQDLEKAKWYLERELSTLS